MDYGVAEEQVSVYGDDHQHQYEDEEYQQDDYPEAVQLHPQQHRGGGEYDNIDDISARHELKHSIDDSSAGKLFVGGIAWETSEDSFAKYFGKFGEISDSVIMMDKISGRPRGFGFITFADSEVANRVLEEEHVLDGRTVEVKRTVPREDMQNKGVMKTKKIFVGGLPISLTEDDLREYFITYGNILEHQIMLDHKTGRSRGFGFVTFETEDAVERIFSDGKMHELGGKRVEIKKAEPKRGGFEQGSDMRMRRGGSSSRGYGGDVAVEYGGGYGKMGRGGGSGGYYGGGYGGYGGYPGSYGGGAGFYGGYGGYGGYGFGFGFGGAMYGGGGGYGGPVGGYGFYGGYDGGNVGGYGGGGGGGGGSKGYGGGGGGAAGSGRYHPYRK